MIYLPKRNKKAILALNPGRQEVSCAGKALESTSTLQQPSWLVDRLLIYIVIN